jgi:class 3 adenylate cyclase/tetratricopeptide (TPR) repeat protein
VICPACGQENPDGFSFCGACGAALAVEPSADVRKTVTVVFCDLVGSTALGERADPEVLRDVMARYHAELRAILERHGGTVEKFVGDAAMAVFGLPQVHEDDALRAVRAAVEMRDAVATLGLDVRIGVNTGEVVAGAGETLATGDAVNVAARLEQSADAGEILLGALTERLVRDAIDAEPVEPLTLKGKSEPVPAFRVLRLIDGVPAFTRRIDAPFVGRDSELAALENAVAAAIETKEPQLATIVGAPGIGKSRLARELLGRVQARVVVGRCLPYGEGITYWPLQEIAAQVGDLRAVLEGTDDAELAATRLEAALGVTDTPVSPEEIAWGIRRVFEELARRRPLVVVFDDIHWAEPTFLDLIEYVASFAQDAAMLVLCTARPDLFDTRPTWTAPKPNATLVTLDALSESDSEALVGLLGALSDDLRERIVRAAEGNPLFVEQLVAMQAEDGAALEIPPTLQALLAARIDRLAGEERAAAQRGSVEGRLFHRGAVTALLPEPERADVGAHLLSLVRKELIRPDRATLPGDDAFRFGHIASAARAATVRQDIAAAVALLERAVQLADADSRGRQYVRLGEALGEADELERSQAALGEGVALAREAGDEHAEWLGRVWLARAQLMHDPEGALDRVFEEATAAVAAREPAHDHEVLAVAWGRIAAVNAWRNQTDAYMDAFERAIQHSRQSGNLALEVNVAGMRAPDFIWGPGRVDDGVRYAEELVDRLGHVPGVQQFALHLDAHMRARLGEFEGALEAIRAYRDNLRELGKGREYAATAGCVWDVCSWSGDLQRGKEALREAYDLLEKTGNKVLLSDVVRDLAEVALREGALEEVEHFCELGDGLSATEDTEYKAHVALLRAKVQAARSDLVTAEEQARRALGMYAETDYLERVAESWLTLAEILRAKGDPDAAPAACEALTLYEQKGNLVGAGWVRAFLAEGDAPQ